MKQLVISSPMTVVVGSQRKSLFKSIRNPRLNICGLEQETLAPDLVVVDGVNAVRAEESAKSFPAEVWRRLERGQGKLVFDLSGEGTPHSPARTDAFHTLLRSWGLAPAAAIYISQDRGYGAAYDAHCDQLGLGDRRMSILVYDRFIKDLLDPYHDSGQFHFLRRLKLHSKLGPRRPRRFLCLNNQMRPARMWLLARLLQTGLWEDGFISMGPIDHLAWRDFARLARSSDDLAPLEQELQLPVFELKARGPCSIGVDASMSATAQRRETINASELTEYRQSWFSIVTESDFAERTTRITEKPFKPLLNFHPFIVLGSPGSLRLIRAYGFDTYPGMFDEQYDDEPDRKARFDIVFKQVTDLCRMDEAQLDLLAAEAKETAIFNAWWGLVELPKLFRTHIDNALVDSLISLCRPRSS